MRNVRNRSPPQNRQVYVWYASKRMSRSSYISPMDATTKSGPNNEENNVTGVLERRLQDVRTILEALEETSTSSSSDDETGRFAERLVRGNLVVYLLHAIQSIPRDPKNDFAPIRVTTNTNTNITTTTTNATMELHFELADVCLLVLMRLHDVALQRLAFHGGWLPCSFGTNAGSVIYQNEHQEESEQPWISGISDHWEARLLQNLPLLYTPTRDDAGHTRWAATVIALYHNPYEDGNCETKQDDKSNMPTAANGNSSSSSSSSNGGGGGARTLQIVNGRLQGHSDVVLTDEDESFWTTTTTLLETNPNSHHSHHQRRRPISVIDVLETDTDSGALVSVRHLVQGVWKGTEHVTKWAMTRNDDNGDKKSLGQQLESFTETTLAGCAMLARSQRCLLIGIGCGNLPHFLKRHCRGRRRQQQQDQDKRIMMKLDIVEPNPNMVDAAVTYFGLDRSIAENGVVIGTVSTVLLHLLESNEEEHVVYDSILINDNSLIPFSLQGSLEQLLKKSNKNACIAIAGSNPPSLASTQYSSTLRSLTLCELKLRDDNDDDDDDFSHEDEDESVTLLGGPNDLSVQDWQVHVSGLSSGAMDVAAARRTPVRHIPGFLSAEDIQAIHSVAAATASNDSVGVETRSDSPGIWTVRHLHTGNLFATQVPHLLTRIVEQARTVGAELYGPQHHWCDDTPFNVRCIEYHSMVQGGRLPDPRHFDQDSIVTIDMMLSNPDTDFTNGSLQTLYANGKTLEKHLFRQGDANIFVSHKAHCVDQVTSGNRRVLVVELWRGPTCYCPHRCLLLQGGCPLDPTRQQQQQQQSTVTPSSNLQPQQQLNMFPFRLGAVHDIGKDTVQILWEPTYTTETTVVPETPRPGLQPPLKKKGQLSAISEKKLPPAANALNPPAPPPPKDQIADDDEVWDLFD
jgi:hypothetical protein